MIRRLFTKRSNAYKALFRGDDKTLNLNADIVLADLRKFCFATGSAFSADPYIHAKNEGRREVMERIRSYVNVTDKELYQLTEKLENEYD